MKPILSLLALSLLTFTSNAHANVETRRLCGLDVDIKHVDNADRGNSAGRVAEQHIDVGATKVVICKQETTVGIRSTVVIGIYPGFKSALLFN